MKKTLLLGAIATLLFVQCGKEKDPFMISNGQVGSFTKDLQTKQIDSIFATDSIVKLNPTENALGTQGEVEVWDKNGEKLLLLSPDNERDPNSTITNIQVFDTRYKTEKGLNSGSTFKDLKDNYTITNIQTTINSVVIFLEETDVYVTIDKKQLSENLRYDPSLKIEASQIPDEAKFKYFMIGWEASKATKSAE
ncbi:hypothetical protein [Cochleicola gelatinilyticus]|uniref:Uncharacterized protein n=1 Tax=Cochleicola gelatinilyticus TaxID=1763537 RepID=A0A167IDN7_9FLAO|nr:hypothetical protein [Cochleicola gelatinilyticus]OAB79551.1 hypothetical protein ULVI_02010 [Cochleicola gelatinilyticus]